MWVFLFVSLLLFFFTSNQKPFRKGKQISQLPQAEAGQWQGDQWEKMGIFSSWKGAQVTG